MESIGEKLRMTREEKTYSIEQVARDTNIAKRFLIALEQEDFDVFPGDPYLIGFLRNYSEYLGLDSNEMINLYRNFKIQAQPVPLEELIVKKDRSPLIRAVVIVVIIAGIVALGVFLFPRIMKWIQERGEAVPVETTTGDQYLFDGEFFERRFSEGDVIAVPIGAEEVLLRLAKVGDDLTIETAAGSFTVKLGEEKLLDIDGNAQDDLKVFVRDIESDEKAVVLRMDKYLKATVPPTVEGTQFRDSQASVTGAVGTPSIGDADVATRRVEPIVISRAATAEPFSLDVVFRGFCLVRYIVDNEFREERYFHKAETFRLDVHREVLLMISNAGSFKARIAGEDVDIGRPGEVTAKLIKWMPDEQSGGYLLTAVPVY